MKLKLTSRQSYQRKQRVWRAWCNWQRTIIRAFFPDTGGQELMMHNWYRCAEKSNPDGAKLADWVKDSTWARLRRIDARLERFDVQREHADHAGRFSPIWCPICNPKPI
jgi:hypothetical protein